MREVREETPNVDKAESRLVTVAKVNDGRSREGSDIDVTLSIRGTDSGVPAKCDIMVKIALTTQCIMYFQPAQPQTLLGERALIAK
jgi:hypothetical protein